MSYRRMWGDMVLVYKIIRGDNQFVRDWFMMNESRTRVHNFKLYKPLVHTIIRFWIMCHIPGTWHGSSTVNITVEEFCLSRKKSC